MGFQRCGPHDGDRRRSCCAQCFERCTPRRLITHWLGAWSRSRPSWASRASATGWCVSDGAASGCCAGDLRGRANRAVNAGCGRYRRFCGVCRAALGCAPHPATCRHCCCRCVDGRWRPCRWRALGFGRKASPDAFCDHLGDCSGWVFRSSCGSSRGDGARPLSSLLMVDEVTNTCGGAFFPCRCSGFHELVVAPAIEPRVAMEHANGR